MGLHDWIFHRFNPHAGSMQDCSQCRCASIALSPLPLIFSYKYEKSLCGTGLWGTLRGARVRRLSSGLRRLVASKQRSGLTVALLRQVSKQAGSLFQTPMPHTHSFDSRGPGLSAASSPLWLCSPYIATASPGSIIQSLCLSLSLSVSLSLSLFLSHQEASSNPVNQRHGS